MPYEIRNSLILAVFLVIMGLSGHFLINMKFGNDFTKIEQELKTKQDRLAQLQKSFSELNGYEKQLNQISDQLKYYPKTILPEQTIHQTYRYLEEIDRYGTFFNFRFNLLGVKRKDNVSTASYELAGEGNFPKAMRFVRRMEYGSPLYKIESLSLKKKSSKLPTEKTSEADLEIVVRLNGIFFTQIKNPDLMALGPYASFQPQEFSVFDPFKPLILNYLPPNIGNLINIENSRLIALTANVAFIQDQQGTVKQVKIGGEIYLGYLSKIDLDKGEAQFLMNRGGITDTYILQLKSSGKGRK
ncbi:MAG: hypothetical protein COT43_08565 [Candidatus Marinimicrobia bacterium CG08_land_8_20_14_0_20_45_22]|nr:MAG: hypothetical protein COT43_08565 [Candidatus Marinimicrobia bacterium CG08_land_8_20_14_0_20_45_22]